MTKRTYEIDANNIEVARDFEEIVKDKREHWRANITTVSYTHLTLPTTLTV